MILLSMAHAGPMQPHSLDIAGRTRSALVYVPEGVEKPPVVFVFHGLGGKTQGLVKQWMPLARAHGLMVVVPMSSEPKDWFAGRFGDLDALEYGLFDSWREWAVQHGADSERVYAMGFSMGAHFTAALLCSKRPLAGAGLVGMSMVPQMETSCAGDPVPTVWMGARGDALANAGDHRLANTDFSTVTRKATLDRLSVVNRCEAWSKPEQNTWSRVRRASCQGAALTEVLVPSDKHALPANAADFIWKEWTAR